MISGGSRFRFSIPNFGQAAIYFMLFITRLDLGIQGSEWC